MNDIKERVERLNDLYSAALKYRTKDRLVKVIKEIYLSQTKDSNKLKGIH